MEINNIITATEAIRSFSDIMNKVYYQHQSFDVKKGKVIVARIIPYNHSSKIEIKNLEKFFTNSPKLEEGDAEAFINEVSKSRLESVAREIKWE